MLLWTADYAASTRSQTRDLSIITSTPEVCTNFALKYQAVAEKNAKRSKRILFDTPCTHCATTPPYTDDM